MSDEVVDEREIEGRLRDDFADRLRRVRAAAQKAAAQGAQILARATPVKSGHLLATLTVRHVTGRSGEPSGSEVVIGGPGAPYVGEVEFGGPTTRPHFFVRKSLPAMTIAFSEAIAEALR